MSETGLPATSNDPWLWRAALGGSVLLWVAFPPLGIWPLAWLGLFLWLVLVDRPGLLSRPGSYRTIWASSFLFWLATDYFVTLPHWAGWFGWIAMSLYLAIYFPLFFATSRALVHRFGVPLVLAAPIAWVGMEWLRAHVITGFGMAMLPHSMYMQPLLIQTADIMGGYGTSFIMLFVVAALVVAVRSTGRRRIGWAVLSITAVGMTVGYGAWRLSFEPSSPQPVPVALIQTSRDVRFELSPEEIQREMLARFRQARDLTREARRRWPDAAVVFWPEGAFPQPDPIPAQTDERLSPEKRELIIQLREGIPNAYLIAVGLLPMIGDGPDFETLNTPLPLLTGAMSFDPATDDEYNSALWLDTGGSITGRYAKMHLVMFGEYIPFGDWFPFVYRWAPIPGGLAAGRNAEAFECRGLWFSPSICFESTVGHLIRRHVIQLKEAGREPDVLVNLTNDGWFYGSNCLDLHLACNVFRAVELRKPMLVAANTGFSAHIDGSGRLIECGPRRQPAALRADVRADGRTSPYLVVGDWPAIGMTVVALGGWILSLMQTLLTKPRTPVDPTQP
jgi:apolipoprotein N-acyltransferase